MQPCILQHKSAERSNLEVTAVMLTKFDKHNRTYTVEDTYFDFGQNWKWTTIIAHIPQANRATACVDSYQAVNPKEWSDIISATTADKLMHFIAALLVRINNTHNEENQNET